MTESRNFGATTKPIGIFMKQLEREGRYVQVQAHT